MVLYTKENCIKCDRIKSAFDLKGMGINVEVIEPDDANVLADLAWLELVDVVEQGALPILVLNDGSYINYETPIRRYLEKNHERTH